MKKLFVSIKTADRVFTDFRKAFKDAKKNHGKKRDAHYEISFDNRKDFERFVGNLHILQMIKIFKPASIYELSKKTGLDVSNLNKIVSFFEELGVIEVIDSTSKGRKVRAPKVNYDKIEFDLAA